MILDELVARSRERVAVARLLEPEGALREQVAHAGPPGGPSFTEALRAPGVSLIAEIKRASPSRGALNAQMDPAAQALRYAAAGADAISVLTEPTRFDGSLGDLRAAHATLAAAGMPRPLLRKDFIVDAYQLLEARLAGAAAVLLIVAALSPEELAHFHAEALALGLTPLVEVHTADEARAVRALQPVAVGINNRDLRTFAVDIETTARLRPLLPTGALVVAESGIHTPEQVRRLAAVGIDAILVGEALVTAPNTGEAVRALKAAGQ